MIPESVLRSVNNFDPLPAPANELLSILCEEKEADGGAEIARLLERHSGLAFRILAVLNSPLYAGRCPVEHLEEAVVRFGGATILDVLLSDYLRTLQLDAPIYGLRADEAFLHAAVASLAVFEVIRENPRKEIPRIASAAALLHDVGKILMSQHFEAKPEDLAVEARRDEIIFAEVEVRHFGCHHGHVGAAIARHWGFPEGMAEAIERHHQAPLPEPTALLDAVALSNLVAKTVGVGLGAEGMNFVIDAGCYTRLGFDFNAFCRVCARTASSIGELRRAYPVKG
jgi:putative nucleotidyltransferase with HDIG domain